MTAVPFDVAHARARRAIPAYFRGRVAAPADRALRAHLPGCASCRHLYQRHLVLAHLDPRALSAEQRIAAVLGIGPARRWRWGRWLATLTVPVAVAAAALVVIPRHPPRVDGEGAFAARGLPPAARQPSFWTYRIRAAGTPELANRALGAADELAFAYSNPGGKRFLMIFGVDEHRHVYWFHPAWRPGQASPLAIPASQGPGPFELDEAIHHDLDAHRLTVYAAFSEWPLDAAAVEAGVRRSSGDGLTLGNDVVVVRRGFDVLP
jgi:Putative zinc-finger